MPKRTVLCFLAVLWLGFGSLIAGEQSNLSGPEQRDNVLVTVEKTGGFAGVHEKFTIYEDGTVANRAGAMRRISIPQLQSIRRKITALGLPKSFRTRLPKGYYCSDCLEYRITFMGPSGKVVLHLDEMQMQAQDSISRLARSTLDLVLGLKWK